MKFINSSTIKIISDLALCQMTGWGFVSPQELGTSIGFTLGTYKGDRPVAVLGAKGIVGVVRRKSIISCPVR